MILEEILFKEAYVLIENAKNLNPLLNQVVDMIVEEAKNNKSIVIVGAGKCSTIALKATETMCSLGISANHLDAYLSQHGDLGKILNNQLLISLSKSGETQEVVECLKGAVHKKAKLISITCNENSASGRIAKENNGLDIVLQCSEEACFLNLAPTSSTILLSSVMDAISVVASEKLLLTKEQFLINHSAGSLSKKIKQELKDKNDNKQE